MQNPNTLLPPFNCLSYDDWTSCIWLTPAVSDPIRRHSSLDSIISISADPSYRSSSESSSLPPPDSEGFDESDELVLRREILKWSTASLALVNIGVGLPVFLGLVSPGVLFPTLAYAFDSNPMVAQMTASILGMAWVQVGIVRWLWVRNFHGQTYGYRMLAGGSYLLEGANIYKLMREGIVGDAKGWVMAAGMAGFALAAFLVRPERRNAGGKKYKSR